MKLTKSMIAAVCAVVFPVLTHAAEVKVAVAANFQKPLEEIAQSFKADTGNSISISAGATGQLFTQIQNGAPFEVMISADSKTPKKLVEGGFAVADSQFTYANGQLVLWSMDEKKVDAAGDVLKTGVFNHIAVANPKSAPYGAAAVEVIDKLGLKDALKTKLVEGQNITQTKQFVDTGNAELGFVALSQIYKGGKVTSGSAWIIPTTLYSPITQDAVLLNTGKDNPVAVELMKYLKGEKAQAIMKNFGYQV